jgi:cyclic pyranopterin phosphate synthase
MKELSHIDEMGKARMVDVSAKDVTLREATAAGEVLMQPATLKLIQDAGMPKGDVLAAARIAGIMAAKRTDVLIPLCHPLPLTGIDMQFTSDVATGEIAIKATVKTVGQTGVEMEALTAVSVAALTIYDMCKAVDKLMTLTNIRLISKKGGKSGTFIREDALQR